MNTRLLLLPMVVAWATALLPSCSLLLDLPADCTPDDCNGFACNDDSTECLFSCDTNAQCSDGHTCNSFTGNGICLPLGCDPITSIRPFLDAANSTLRMDTALNGDGTLFAVAFIDASGNLKAQLFDIDGSPVGAILSLEASSMTPGRPNLVWNGAGWGVVWEATGLAGNPGVERVRDLLRFAYINADGSLSTSTTEGPELPTTLWFTRDDERSVDDPAVAWDSKADVFAASWSTQLDANSDLYMLTFRQDGTSAVDGTSPIPHEEGVRITLSEGDTFSPHIELRTQPDDQPNLYDVVFREGSNLVRLGLRTVDGSGNRVFGEDVDLGLNVGSSQIADFGYTSITTGNVTAFSERSAAFTKAYRVQLLPSRSIAQDNRFEIGVGLEDVVGTTVASAGSGEYAILFTANNLNSRGVYLTRYRDDGAPINTTFEVSDDTIFDPEHPVLQALPEGYAIFYTDSENGAVGQIWTCSPP
ncbi:MAG: hypothetical protein AAFX99_03185 [Myxococcota bacterium]